MLDKGDVITLDNNKEYVVVNIGTYKSKIYVYLISHDEMLDTKFCLLENDTLRLVQDEVTFKALLDIFNSKEGEQI